jgi:serine protease SohB
MSEPGFFDRVRGLVPGGRAPVVAVLRLAGVIGQIGPVRAGLTLANQAAAIERAFSLRGLAAVALAVNSPGGAPVQSALIYARIRALAEEKKVPVLAFAEDVAASGGYWLALAADEIFADANSIVGSIGVVSAGFGFQDMIDKLGIERRVHTAGANKAMLDPFRPEEPAHVARLQAIQQDMHESFKMLVRARRGARLKGPEDEIFEGAFWTGRRALDLGLIDGLGDLRQVCRARFGDRVRLRAVGQRQSWLLRRIGLGAEDRLAHVAGSVIAALEERALWARYGL